MKKYMIPAVALLMIAGMANAQVQKKPNTASTAKEAVAKSTASKSSNVASTASVTPKNTPAANTASAIKRKHHRKASKATKVGNK